MTKGRLVIPYATQSIQQQDIEHVVEVLKSDFLTQGPVVPKFEQYIAKYCEAKFAVATNSATSALHIACLALGLKERDYLWTSPNTFVASANCGLYCGAQLDFVDIDPLTYNLSVEKLEEKLILAKKTNKLPKILVAVHFAGQSCEMNKIYKLSKEYNFKIIEDASHAIGSRYLDNPVGNSSFSDITIFSFHPVKIITTAEGGMAVTNQQSLYEKMQLLRSHGVTRDPKLMTVNNDEGWYYEQVDLGFNYRMTELQAALGISQLERLDFFINKRQILKEKYDTLLQNLPVIIPYQDNKSYSALHLYPIQLEIERLKKSRKQIFCELRNAGIGVNVHYIPVYLQPYYRSLGFKQGYCPVAEKYYHRAMSLPMYPDLLEEQLNYVCSKLEECCQ
ncbi:AHBA synthase [Legionella busanensis]|uniref:AHBA synthase n=1 Tax=Legionella busanensis TaxID=190655 RepID=A0A378JJK3_9GAMM|nr:UDP-4-amino-4,6-dideoxy-N-acetyl-beta-L-altrosamine transaminase [Legionella busanensis]STX51395.1 AHBA synthase [Legionella busanensis]